MKSILLLSILFLICTPSFADNFIGTYHCKGYDPYLNQNYSGKVTVEQQNTVYKITMRYDTGEIYRATGGLYDKTLLSVVFQDEKNLNTVGLEQYQLLDDKNQMGGFWVYLGKDKLGREVCTRIVSPETNKSSMPSNN